MKVVDWIFYDDAESRPEAPISGCGGWFGAGERVKGDHFSAEHTWADYLEHKGDAVKPYAEALRDAIVERRLWEDGGWHQGSDAGSPVFDDGTVATFSFRAWGDLLAAIWTGQLGRQYCYMDFYHFARMAPRPEDLEARCRSGVKR